MSTISGLCCNVAHHVQTDGARSSMTTSISVNNLAFFRKPGKHCALPAKIHRGPQLHPHVPRQSGVCVLDLTFKSTNGDGKGRRRRDVEVDIAVVGAGIVGLSVAHHILEFTPYSVALVDSAQPCAGATGAGQGYIWMGHRSPGTPGWDLARQGKGLWEALLAQLQAEGPEPLGWKNTGSLLVAQTPLEAGALRQRMEALQRAGVDAHFLDALAASEAEPLLAMPGDGGALLVPGDSQLDAELAVRALLERCRKHGGAGQRYVEIFQEPASSLLWSGDGGQASGVVTSGRTVRSPGGVVLATGVWSPGLAATLLAGHPDLPCVPLVQPRKGHLLVVEGLPQISLRHALMEAEYSANYAPGGGASSGGKGEGPLEAGQDSGVVAVSMTATVDWHGRLLIGSSREFSGFGTGVEATTIQAMVGRAAAFLPVLGEPAVRNAIALGQIRTGLRPYSGDGRPVIGPVPRVRGLHLACGHEGSGLCMALATAELIIAMMTGAPPAIDPTPFLPDQRLLQPKDIALS